LTRSGLLFLSPIMPDETGNGLAMRAGVTLRALAKRFEVHLGLVPVAGGPEMPSPLVRRCAASVRTLPLAEHLDPHYRLIERVIDPAARRRAALAYPKPYLARFCTGRAAAVVAEWSSAIGASTIHVMRLYLAPLVTPQDDALRVLDLDEDDVTTHRRIADLHRRDGNTALAERFDGEAAKFEALATQSLGRFDRALVSSPVEAERIRQRASAATVSVVPNAAPAASPPARSDAGPGRPLRLFFVGTLGYAPNRDAVEFLCRELLPRLRAGSPRAVTARVAGAGASPALVATAAAAGVELLGPVADLAPLYAEADIALVPIRAAGGTRIKILEAFAYGAPVVSTTVGIEGIAAHHGEHALIVDGADAFAEACLVLAADPAQARAMAARARTLVDTRYSVPAVEAELLVAYGIDP
jgi:glycosyltransferase involved in cell wall biosynthesis